MDHNKGTASKVKWTITRQRENLQKILSQTIEWVSWRLLIFYHNACQEKSVAIKMKLIARKVFLPFDVSLLLLKEYLLTR